MKLALGLFAIASAMEGHGKPDKHGIHIGGGAFDQGTTDNLALWAIRKCKKKVCAVWPWAKCPLKDVGEIDKDERKTRGPCCHKCWNKCPPFLARHKMSDKSVFSNSAKRRDIKEEVWQFLQEDIECETSRLKDEFMSNSVFLGHSMEALVGVAGGAMESSLANPVAMLNDGMLNDATPQRLRNAAYCDEDGQGYPKGFNYYKCHGHKDAFCCSNRCRNQPNAKGGRCEPCQCNGKCEYMSKMKEVKQAAYTNGCDLEASEAKEPKEREEPEEPEYAYEEEPEE